MDDNQDDNTFIYFVPSITTPIIESNDWAWTVISAIVLLAFAKIFGFLEIKTKKQEQANTRRVERTEKIPEVKFIQNDINEEVSMHIEDEKDNMLEEVVTEELINEEVVSEEEVSEEETIEVTDIDEIDSGVEDDIDAKINKMMSRKRYYD